MARRESYEQAQARIARQAQRAQRSADSRARESAIYRPKKRNPVAAAADLSEAWHGRPAKSQREVVEEIQEHGVLTDLGRLEELELSTGRKSVIPLADFGPCRLCSSEGGGQLYLVGGDQSIDLAALGIKSEKEFVPLGECRAVTYVTAKQHLSEEDKTAGPYRHEFGEEGGGLPLLVYDVRNKLLSLVGGSYTIKRDIAGKYSAGLRD